MPVIVLKLFDYTFSELKKSCHNFLNCLFFIADNENNRGKDKPMRKGVVFRLPENDNFIFRLPEKMWLIKKSH